MIRHFLTIICILSAHIALTQTKEESIKELMKVMKQDSLIDQTFNSVMPMMHQQIQKQYGGKSSEASEELYKFTMQQASIMAKKMINEDFLAIYDTLFTQSQILDFIAFYKSPSGQKLLFAMPEMQKQLMNIVMTKYMPELQQKIKQRSMEIKPKHNTH